jgi:maltose 6'-phosphate phosphatase
MDKIRLRYAVNVISRQTGTAVQHLSFFLLVQNLGYDKLVDVVWAGEDGVWHTLPAVFHGAEEDGWEYWQAGVSFAQSPQCSLPGNVDFALRYRVNETEYWDNNGGLNHDIQADSGIRLAQGVALQNVIGTGELDVGQRVLPVTVAVHRALEAEKVTIHWSADGWRTVHQTACRFKRNFWNSEMLSNARNPNQYGVAVWKGWLKLDDAFGVQYSICCEGKGRSLWENNGGRNYVLRHAPLKVLILNLHCYQEKEQDFKFSQIARAIDEQEIDIVCLQEVAELWNDGQGDWSTNSARIINERLKQPFHLATDWSHLGFERYREGVAILSRYPLVKHEAKYVSSSQDPYDIHARKVVMAQVKVPNIGLINVFSSHLSWVEDGFAEQFDNLRSWASSLHGKSVKATLLCGDFNIKAGGKGYERVVDSGEYEDQYLAANAPAVFNRIFHMRRAHWQRYLADDHRIDYIFMHKGSALRVTSGLELFTEQDYGRVSDHTGYMVTFEPR